MTKINKIPVRETSLSAGADIRSSVSVSIIPNQIKLIPTGSYITNNLPEDHFLMLCIRSSLANKGLCLANGVGVIDKDFKDEIHVMVHNVTDEAISIYRCERIAQLIPVKFNNKIYPCKQDIRSGGFGSTGGE
jgi:dUTP pyrophosphatase